MKKDKNTQTKKRREYNAGRIFGKFMLAGTFATLIFALM